MEARTEFLSQQLTEAGLDAIVCSLPKNVLLLTGYWPVIGTGMAIAASSGQVWLIAPQDEERFAKNSRAMHIDTFKPSTLNSLASATDHIIEPLKKALGKLDGKNLTIGYEHSASTEPASYSAVHIYSASMADILRQASPGCKPVPADDQLKRLLALKTGEDVTKIRVACRLTQVAFEGAAEILEPGISEVEAAAELNALFCSARAKEPSIERAEAFFFVMSGPNSYKAHGAYAHSSTRRLAQGDLVLVHCNSYVDGYATDITRTFSLGKAEDKRQPMYDAIFLARQAALSKVRPQVRGCDVDDAARQIIQDRGFGSGFKHSTGHGVGFGAISPDALPRLHPKSPDMLQPGMVFNVEPAIYIEGFGGIRHCDMAAVTEHGFELLTPFQTQVADLFLSPSHERLSSAVS